jgi:phosphoglycolate phosphatase
LSNRLQLILFNVDGTLVDSQASIIAVMQSTFDAIDYPLPSLLKILSIVGLSLPNAFKVLLENEDQALNEKACNAYKASFANARIHQEKLALFDGLMDVLTNLRAMPETYLGVATRESRRGLDALLKGHSIEDWFVTQQVADNHPSKSHPSMIGARVMTLRWRLRRAFFPLVWSRVIMIESGCIRPTLW